MNIELKMPIAEKSSTKRIKLASVLGFGLKNLMKTPPVIVPKAIVPTEVAPVKKEALEADCRYCSIMYLGFMM